jgi:hypothetical protein
LLNNPSISVDDFETALSNPDHLRQILSTHNFEFNQGIKGKLNPAQITNPLLPDLEIVKSEYWIIKSDHKNKLLGSGTIRRLAIYDWKAGHGPQKDVFRTIEIFFNRDSIYAKNVNRFLERIKDRYVLKTKRFSNSDLFPGEPYYVLVNNQNPKIEIRKEKTLIDPSGTFYSYNSIYPGYIISFDLLK